MIKQSFQLTIAPSGYTTHVSALEMFFVLMGVVFLFLVVYVLLTSIRDSSKQENADIACIILPNGEGITVEVRSWKYINGGQQIQIVSDEQTYIASVDKVVLKLGNTSQTENEVG